MSVVDNNSTRSLLPAGGVFQGKTYKPDSKYITVQVSFQFFGALTGRLEIYYSLDGVYFDNYGDSWDYLEGHYFKETQLKGNYFYVKFTNTGSSAQTQFDLHTKLTTSVSTVSVDGVINIPEVNVNIDGETVYARLRDANNNDIGSYDGNLNVFDSNSVSLLNSINNKTPSGLTLNGDKLKVDISGQRVLTDISGQTLKVNTISGFATESTLGTTNSKLDTLNTSVNNKHLFFTNDSVTIGDISSGVQVGINNFPLVALDATLQTTNTNLDTLINKHLDNSLDSVQVSGAVNVNKVVESVFYNLDNVGTAIYADSINGAVIDPYGRAGWFWTNEATTGGSNAFWYSNSIVPQNPMSKAQMECVYIILALDRVEPNIVLPFIPMYSKPTGSGDHIPGFAHSVWTYTIPATHILNAGEVVMLTIGDHTKVDKIRPELRRVHLELNSTEGSGLPTENIAYVSLNTDSALKDVGAIQYLLQNAGFHYSVNDKITDYEFNNGVQKYINDNLTNQGIKIRGDVNVTGTVNIGNFPPSFEVSNFPSSYAVSSLPSVEVNNFPTGFNINNVVDVSGYVSVSNQLTGFALDSTLTSTNSKLDTLNTTVTNKHLSKTLDSVDISGQRVDISGQSISVNVISGFALDTTLTTTNSKLDTLNTTVTNKHLSKTTDSIDISGQRVDISGQVVVIAGQTVYTNLKAYDSILDNYFAVTSTNIGLHTSALDIAVKNTVDISGNVAVSNMISGFALDSTLTTTNSKLDTLNTTVTNKHLSKALDSVDISGQRVDISGQRVICDVSGQRVICDISGQRVDISGETVNSNMYVSTNGTNWHHMKADANGVLNTHSMLQDGAGNDLTSKLIASSRALDVNIINTANPIIIDFSNPILDVIGTVGINNFPTTQGISGDVNVNNFPTTQAVSGTFWQATQPVSGTFYQATQPVSLASNVGIKDSSGNSIKADASGNLNVNIAAGTISVSSVNVKDSSGNSLTSTSNNLDTNMKCYNRSNATTATLSSVQPVGATSSVKALETYSYMVALDNGNSGFPLQVTSTVGAYTNSLDCQIQNGSTSNVLMDFATVEKGTGLNMYVIPSKTKTFLFNAYSNNTSVNASISSIGNTATFSAYNWGLANPKNTWNVYRTGTSVMSFYYTYINASGNEIDVTTPVVLTSATTYYPLATGIVTVNSWRTNAPMGTGDTLYVCSTASTANAYCGANYLIQTNSLWTCPNNCIAWVQNMSFYASGAEGLRLFKWDVNGIRSILWNWVSATNFTTTASGEYGYGGYIKAGETIGWGGENASLTRNVSANIVCRYL